jgi:iron complex transport system substrate-binding protein
MRLGSLVAALLIGAAPALAQERVVVAGSALCETIAALGQGHRVVGRDTTCTHPAEMAALPDIGYLRALSAEGLLALGPDLILAGPDAGPPETMALVEASAVPVIRVAAEYTEEGVIAQIEAVAQALGVEGGGLVDRVRDGFARLAQARSGTAPVRALFILSAAGGRVMAAGTGTGADGMFRLAGAENALQGIDGYRQITDEALAAAAPEVIVMMDRAGDHALSDAQILAHPALGLTPAGQAGRVVRMDGAFLLGFGPRTPEAALALMAALHGG